MSKLSTRRWPFDYNEYFEWLMAKVGGNVPPHNNYRLLITHLHSVEYRYTLPDDSSRASKGQNLRYHFSWENEQDIDDEVLRAPCTVLEMLVSLAEDVEHYILGVPGKDSTEEWFWIMMANLGLDKMDDQNFNIFYINEKLNTLMLRAYDRNGNGGLFPQFSYVRDARVTGLWQQASDYFSYG